MEQTHKSIYRAITYIVLITAIVTAIPVAFSFSLYPTFLTHLKKRPLIRDVEFVFTSTAWNATGSAKVIANTTMVTELLLTPNAASKCGAVWYEYPIDFKYYNMVAKFLVYLGSSKSGGDGIVFVIASKPNQVGVGGGGLGYMGIRNSIGVELDTFPDRSLGDPSKCHIAIDVNGTVDHKILEKLYGLKPVTVGNLKDGKLHVLTVIWNATEETITVKLDGKVVIRSQHVNLLKFIGGDVGYIGFTGATGMAHNEQYVIPVNVTLIPAVGVKHMNCTIYIQNTIIPAVTTPNGTVIGYSYPIQVSLENCPYAAGLLLELQYNNSYINVTEVIPGSFVNYVSVSGVFRALCNTTFNNTLGLISTLVAGVRACNLENVPLLTIMARGIKGGNFTMTVKKAIIALQNGTVITATSVKGGKIEVKIYPECDFNLNGRLDIGDVELCLKYVEFHIKPKIYCDLNNNGVLDIADCALLLHEVLINMGIGSS